MGGPTTADLERTKINMDGFNAAMESQDPDATFVDANGGVFKSKAKIESVGAVQVAQATVQAERAEDAADLAEEFAGVSVRKSTRALLYADLAHDADVVAGVYADATAAYNGAYIKIGASGTGSWSQTSQTLGQQALELAEEIDDRSPSYEHPDYAWGVVDEVGNSPLFVDWEGATTATKIKSGKYVDLAAEVATELGVLQERTQERDHPDALWGVIDELGRSPLYVDPDGKTRIAYLQADYIALGTPTSAMQTNYELPEAHGALPGLDGTAGIIAALATGKTVYLGGVGKTWNVSASLGTMIAGSRIISDGAIINYSADAEMLLLGNGCEALGLIVNGSGMASGKTAQAAVVIPATTSRTKTDLRVTDMGGAGFIARDNVHRKGNVFTVNAANCPIGLDLKERGEYTVGNNCAASGCTTGFKVRAGNACLVNPIACDNGVGLELVAGDNDAHGSVIGGMINHNTVNVRCNAVNTKEFFFIGVKMYSGNIELLGCEGIQFKSCGFGGVITIIESGAKRCGFSGSTFNTIPTFTPNHASLPSAVHYWDNEYTASTPVLGDDDLRIPSAQSRVTLSAPQTVTTGTAPDVVLNTVTKKALQRNADFTAYTLWNATGYWEPKSFCSPNSRGHMTVDVRLSIGKTATWNGDLVEAYISVRDASGVEQDRIPLHKTSERTDGTNYWRVFYYQGPVLKYNRMALVVKNDLGSSVDVYANSGVTKPTFGYVTGW